MTTMSNSIHAFLCVLMLSGAALYGSSDTAFAGAGAPPTQPIKTPETGADLKYACGQNSEDFEERVSEQIHRTMLIVQCRATVAAIVELVNNGQYTIDGALVWQCVKDREDHDALAAQYVKWVGRKPVLLRKSASIAFIEAIEMSEKCRN